MTERKPVSRPALPLALAVAAALAACASSVPEAARVPAGFAIGLVTDSAGIEDRSFNEMAWQGIERFAADYGLARGTGHSFRQSFGEADFLPNLSDFGEAGASLLVAPGFLFYDVLPVAAARYPRSDFLIIDSLALDGNDAVPPNVAWAASSSR